MNEAKIRWKDGLVAVGIVLYCAGLMLSIDARQWWHWPGSAVLAVGMLILSLLIALEVFERIVHKSVDRRLEIIAALGGVLFFVSMMTVGGTWH